jgi:hypothetical protein
VKELPPVYEYETAAQYRERAQMAFQKTNFQHLNEVNELEAKVAAAIGKNIEDTIEQANQRKIYEETLKRNEELEAENKALRDKSRRIDEINCALKNNLPSVEVVQRFRSDMQIIATEGRMQMIRDEQELEAASLADDVLNQNK